MYRLAFLLLLLPGCSLGPAYTPDELEWRHQMARENWALCEQVYAKAGVVTIHRGHTHSRPVRISAIRQDLAENHCRRVLGPYWAD